MAVAHWAGEKEVEMPQMDAGKQVTVPWNAYKYCRKLSSGGAAETSWEVAYQSTFNTHWELYWISWELGCGAGEIFWEGHQLELYWTL